MAVAASVAVAAVIPPSSTKDEDAYVGASVAFEGACVGAFMDGAAVALPPDQDLSHTLPPVPYLSIGLSSREGDFVWIGGNGQSKKKEAKIEKEMTRNFLAQCCCVALSRCHQIKIFHTLSRQYPIRLSAYQVEKVILFG